MVEPKFCVVCGMGSHRDDWADKPNPACDSHSPAEVKAALAAKKPSAPPPSQPATPASTLPAEPQAQPPKP